jgi:hypothetical protein
VGSNPTLSAKIKRDLHQVPFYFGGVGLVDEPTGFDKIAGCDFGRAQRARRARARMARVNPTLSGVPSMQPFVQGLFKASQPLDLWQHFIDHDPRQADIDRSERPSSVTRRLCPSGRVRAIRLRTATLACAWILARRRSPMAV